MYTSYTDQMYDNYLTHYGVPGMKWGQHKSKSYTDAKANYKSAKKQYTKDFNAAYRKRSRALSPFKKQRQAQDERWKKAANSAEKVKTTKAKYKSEKQNYKSSKNQARQQQKQDYKTVKNKLKKANVKSMQLQNYERGGVSKKKVEKYLGKNTSVKQVSNYLKERNRRATVGTIVAATAGMSLATLLAYKK